MRKLGATALAIPVLAAVYLAALRAHGGFQRVLAGLGAALDHRRGRRGQPPAREEHRGPGLRAGPRRRPLPRRRQDRSRHQGPHRDRVRRPHGRRVGRRRAADLARRADQRLVGCRGPPPDDLPHGALAPRTPCTPSRSTAARAPRPAASSARRSAASCSPRPRARGRSRPPGRSAIGSAPTRRSRSSSIAPSRSRPFARRSARPRRSTASCSRAPHPANTSSRRGARSAPARSTESGWTGSVDADGLPFEAVPAIVVSTGRAPSVVRFRPVSGTAKVERTAILSVRFTQPMQRTATAGAFVVVSGGHRVTGKIAWAEAGTVLVFTPSRPLAYGAGVLMTVNGSARSRGGARVEAASATFRVVPKPAPRVRAAGAPTGGGGGGGNGGGGGGGGHIPHAGGGGAANGSWGAVERYYLQLMNCTRTGGWVTGSGNCNSPAAGTSTRCRSARGSPTTCRARTLATWRTTTSATTSSAARPGDRLRRAGYDSYRWAENLGCRSGNPFNAVLGSHLFFQSEKPYNGGHYREPDEPRLRPLRDRRLGRQRPRPAGDRLLPPLIAGPAPGRRSPGGPSGG